MKGNLLEALPLLLGAVLGVWLYYSVLPLVAVVAGLALVAAAGLLAEAVARGLLARRPVAAVRVWQGEVLVPVAVIAVGGYVSMWVVDSVPDWLARIPLLDTPPSTDATAKEWTKTVSAALSTAITAFLGALLLDDEKKSDGGLWPAARIRKAMRRTFGARVDALKAPFEQRPGEPDEEYKKRTEGREQEITRYESVSRALYDEEISIVDPAGWTLPGALVRARIVREILLGGPPARPA